jgi:hypothetical protein
LGLSLEHIVFRAARSNNPIHVLIKQEWTMAHQQIANALALIFEGIEQLKSRFPHRMFTIDGRLVGDIGEVIAALEYDLEIDEVSQRTHDGRTPDGRLVQVKATFKDSLTFRSVPEYLIGLKLYPDGSFEEIYNGPGHVVYDRYAHRRNIGKELLSFPLSSLTELSKTVPEDERIARRPARPPEESVFA